MTREVRLMRHDRQRASLAAIVAASCVAGIAFAQPPAPAPSALRAPDVRYQPTSMDVVHAMLRLADVKAGDVVCDLGCGDGRIVITAARELAAHGVCVDIDPRRIAESRENARQAGVTHRIRFLNDDLMAAGIGDATVVMLFLSPGSTSRCARSSCVSSNPAPASSRTGTTWATGSRSEPCVPSICGPSRNAEAARGHDRARPHRPGAMTPDR